MANKKKVLTSGIAVVSAAALLFGGTFAWQSISQTALNEVSASVNPGGRLHDDFAEITEQLKANVTANEDGTTPLVTMSYDKNVYVENFTEYATNGAQVYARVRLDEYMELGQNAGKLNGTEKAEDNKAVSVVAGAKLDDKTTWTTHKIGEQNDKENPFHQYWDWEMGGDAVTYMPTFNKNKDSLEADINGSFAKGFKDYVDYSKAENASKTGIAIYDADAAEDGDEIDELGETLANAGLTLADVIDKESEAAAKELLDNHNGQLLNKPNVNLAQETHEAKETLSFDSADAQIISMADWKQLPVEEQSGNFWVYDEDGWAYWAAPINPETATAPLLNGISRTEKIINQDWYYAINVVAQFITYDDMGQADNTGFYDISEGSYPTADALTLLSAIGVDVPTADVSTEEELTDALAQGGIINVTGDIDLTEQLNVNASCVLNLNGNTISTETDIYDDNVANGSWSLLSVQNEATVVINGGTFRARENDSYAVDVRDGSKVIIEDGTFIGNVSAVYVKEGEAVINGGTFSIQQTGAEGVEYKYVLNCLDANYASGTAKITVTGGSFEHFDPAGDLENTDPHNYLADGYQSTPDGDWYTVTPAGTVEDTETL